MRCKFMNIGHSFQIKYYMGEGPGRKELVSVHQEKDLGVITTSDLKSFSQCTKSAATARKVIGLIAMVRRTFKNLDTENFRLLYKTYSRLHLEFSLHSSLVPAFRQRYYDPGKCSESGNESCTEAAEMQLSCETTNDRHSLHWKLE